MTPVAVSKTALVVEDSPTQALNLRTLLEGAGLHVLMAYDGQAALQMARQHALHVVVLDLEMPAMNGFQVCQLLKEAPDTRDIPVIMFTSHGDREAIVLGLQIGAVEYIPKDTFAAAILIETLRRMDILPSTP